jgi:hypothetical protein
MHFPMMILYGVRLRYFILGRFIKSVITGIAYTIDSAYEAEVRDYLG